MRRLIIGVLVLILLATALYTYLRLEVLPYTKVTVGNKTADTISIYPVLASDQGPNIPVKNQLLATVGARQSVSIRLRKNSSYVALLSDSNKTYQDDTAPFQSGPSASSVNIDPNYSDSKLLALLSVEKPAILAAMDSQLSGWSNTYNLGTLKLYQHGDWAGVILDPKDTVNFDVLRTVLKKTGSDWKVQVNPPRILIPKPAFTSIPSDIVDDIDNFSQ